MSSQFEWQQYQQAWSKLTTCQQLPHIPLRVFDSLPSTNLKLWELLETGEKTPIAAIALSQTAGRGQWGRIWQSPRGGLYLSVAITPQLQLQHSFHLTLATAWGIATALRQHTLPVLLKWPNDLILHKRKLGGIKIETRTQQARITQAVIGVGINWQNPVPEPGINLQSVGNTIALEQLAAIAIYGILSGYQRYTLEGIEPLLPNYLNILDSLGRSVTIDGYAGVVIGVTTEGKLKIRFSSPGAVTQVCLSPGQISLGYDI